MRSGGGNTRHKREGDSLRNPGAPRCATLGPSACDGAVASKMDLRDYLHYYILWLNLWLSIAFFAICHDHLTDDIRQK